VHLSVLVSPASVGAHSSPTRNSLRSVRSVRSRAVPVPHVRPVPFASLAFTHPPLLRPCNGGGGGCGRGGCPGGRAVPRADERIRGARAPSGAPGSEPHRAPARRRLSWTARPGVQG
jgi:hypothetical protein